MQTCSTGSCAVVDATDNSGQTVGIRHAFRRNDESGTTDVFVTLLGAPSISQLNNTSHFCNVGKKGPTYFAASPADKECNADTDCISTGIPAGICATDATSSTGKRCSLLNNAGQSDVNTTAGFADDHTLPPPLRSGRISNAPTDLTQCLVTGRNVGEYLVDLQDLDVIRRVCIGIGGAASSAASEDVCSARGDLGLVLPIWDVPQGIAPLAESFPQTACTGGKFLCFPATRTNCTGTAIFATCPDGSN